MAELNVTFFAFAKREKRFVLTRATLGYIVANLLISAGAVALAWPVLSDLAAWYFEVMGAAANGEEPSAPPAIVWQILPLSLAFGLIGLIVFAAFEAACLRWLVRGESGGGLLGLTLGADTWRVLATYCIWLLLGIGFLFLCALPIVVLQALHGAAPGLVWLWLLLGALTPLGLLALLLWGATRLSPAAAMSIREQRFAFFSAWRVTRPHFWSLLGAFVILTVGYVVIAMVIGQVFQIFWAPYYAPVMQHAMNGDGGAIAAQMMEILTDPVVIALGALYLVATMILRCAAYIAFFGVNAGVVRAEAPAT